MKFLLDRSFRSVLIAMFLSLATVAITGDYALAQEEAAEVAEEVAEPEAVDLGVGYALDNAFLFIAAVMVFFMQAGFAMVEAGFNSSKNAVNILFKNSMDICVGVLLFYFIGFGIMYPGCYGVEEVESKWFAFGGVGLDGYESVDDRTFSPEVDWMFQAVFAATAATIVSGAVAGRMKVAGYLIYSAVLTGFIYPISGMWKWGGGPLDAEGFSDFAGSAVVHGVGGFAGLAGAIILGPRIGRFVNGKSVPMPGHSLPIAALGVFILWFGWYGFNPGSQLAFQSTADIDATMHVAVTTTLAAASGGLVATLLSWFMFGKPDLSMGLNGILGGLVGITACCDVMSYNEAALIIGPVAGALIIFGVMMLDKFQIDDPVGAFPVHGLCGVWGCLSIGILHGDVSSFGVQLKGTLFICGFAFVTMLILFSVLKGMGILRVSEAEEQKGLDVSEHGMQAYGGSAATM
ncbi:MAG: ammonium transporter [Planctomycetota bacterium]